MKNKPIYNRSLNRKLCNLLNNMAVDHFKQECKHPMRQYRIKVCNNQFCIENSKDITVYLKGKRKDIPICGFRNFCPDAHFRYFDYKPEYVKKGGK
jgi:hypothetical protein